MPSFNTLMGVSYPSILRCLIGMCSMARSWRSSVRKLWPQCFFDLYTARFFFSNGAWPHGFVLFARLFRLGAAVSIVSRSPRSRSDGSTTCCINARRGSRSAKGSGVQFFTRMPERLPFIHFLRMPERPLIPVRREYVQCSIKQASP